MNFELTEEEIALKKFYENAGSEIFSQITTIEKLEETALRCQSFDVMADAKVMSELLMEDMFIPEAFDVSVIRHPRYAPPLLHSHMFIEINYVLSGESQYVIGNNHFQLKRGDAAIIAPGTTHSIYTSCEETIILNLLIRASTFDTVFFGTLLDNNILSSFFSNALYDNRENSYILFQTGTDTLISRQVLDIYNEYLGQQNYKRNMLNILLSRLMISLLRFHEQDAYIPDPKSNNHDNHIILILNYIQANYRTTSLSETARFFNYSERHLSRLLKRYGNTTFTKILNEARLQKAAKMLKSSSLTVSEIALATGYHDISHFHKTFKKYYHKTPLEYRAN